MMSARRMILVALAALGLTLAASPIAGASVPYGLAGSFGGVGVQGPVGVAVSQANDVYVANFASAGRLDELSAAGSLIAPPSPFGNGLQFFGGYFFSGLAVDPVSGHLYAIDGLGQEIQTYDGATGALLSHFSVAGSANVFEFATVVQIASDAAGNIYFPNAPHDEVQELSPEGALLATFTGAGAQALKAPTGVAVDAAGDVYVADNGNGRMEEFTQAGAFVMAIGTGVDQTTKGDLCTAASGDTCGPGSDGSQAVALDASGDILVGENGGAGFHVVVYSPAGEALADFGLGTIGTSEFGAVNTLAVGPTGLVYVADGGNSLIRIYAQQSKPALRNVSASAVRQTSATLNATIDEGYAETTYHFEYGTGTAYGTLVPVPDTDIGNGGVSGTPATVGEELSGLQPGTTYHYRVVATNSVGQTVGPDATFTTPPLQPPVLSTGQAASVGQNTATLTATIDTQGHETVYEFDLGVDTSYGTRIFGDAGSQPGAQTFTAALQGLMPSSTYHYRVAATNAFGTTYGADQTFTTAAYLTETLTPPQSPPLLPTTLLAPTPLSGGAAKAAVVRATAQIAKHATPKTHKRKRHRQRGSGRGHSSRRGGK